MKKLYRFILIIPLLACFLLASYSTTIAQTADTKLFTMQDTTWSLKVDSTLATAIESNNKPFTTTLKDGAEKELFLILNSPTDAAQGKIEFKVETTGLSIYKQLPLDKELTVGEQYDFINATHVMLKGKTVVYRPENVVNSFACYDNSGQKVLHIYASKLIDAKGESVWVDSELKDGLLTIYLDSKFLESAVYPIVIDPIFGFDSIGASVEYADPLKSYGSVFTTSEAMSFNKMWVYNGDNYESLLYGAIYNLNLTRIAITNSNTSVGGTFSWLSLDFNSTINLNAGTYILVAGSDKNDGYGVHYKYDSGSTNQGIVDNTGVCPNPLTNSSYSTNKYSMYIEYTEYVEPTPTPEPTEEPTATPTPTVIYQAVPINYLNSAALIFLAIVCIALTIKPQVPILNFIFGVIVLGISAATAGQSDMLLWGYMPLMTVILAIVCMLSGYVSWKR